jgi:YHS domain-containing protein
MKSRILLNALVCGAITVCFVSASSAQPAAAVKKDTKVVTEKSTPAAKVLKPQTTCPVQGNPINKKLFVDYKGKRIFVCCEGCIADVKKDPEKYIKKLADEGQGVMNIAPAKAPKTPKKTKAAKPATAL